MDILLVNDTEIPLLLDVDQDCQRECHHKGWQVAFVFTNFKPWNLNELWVGTNTHRRSSPGRLWKVRNPQGRFRHSRAQCSRPREGKGQRSPRAGRYFCNKICKGRTPVHPNIGKKVHWHNTLFIPHDHFCRKSSSSFFLPCLDLLKCNHPPGLLREWRSRIESCGLLVLCW